MIIETFTREGVQETKFVHYPAQVFLHATLSRCFVVSHVRSLNCPRDFFFQFLSFRFVIFAENGHCSFDYPEPVETFCSLLSINQQSGDTSCYRRGRHYCHARCGILILKACMRDGVSCCVRGTCGSFSGNRHRNDNPDDDDHVDDRKQYCPRQSVVLPRRTHGFHLPVALVRDPRVETAAVVHQGQRRKCEDAREEPLRKPLLQEQCLRVHHFARAHEHPALGVSGME